MRGTCGESIKMICGGVGDEEDSVHSGAISRADTNQVQRARVQMVVWSQ